VKVLEEDAADLIEAFGFQEQLKRLKARIGDPSGHSAFGKLTKGILNQGGVSSPFQLSGDECNRHAEAYYRTTLKRQYLQEGLDWLKKDVEMILAAENGNEKRELRALCNLFEHAPKALVFLESRTEEIVNETLLPDHALKLLGLLLISFGRHVIHSNEPEGTHSSYANDFAPIY
jgi:hypothetical protein